MKTKSFRATELKQHKAIWLEKTTYEILRAEKRKQKLTMARIVDNLIREKYGQKTIDNPAQ